MHRLRQQLLLTLNDYSSMLFRPTRESELKSFRLGNHSRSLAKWEKFSMGQKDRESLFLILWAQAAGESGRERGVRYQEGKVRLG